MRTCKAVSRRLAGRFGIIRKAEAAREETQEKDDTIFDRLFQLCPYSNYNKIPNENYLNIYLKNGASC